MTDRKNLTDIIFELGCQCNKHANYMLAREIEVIWSRLRDISTTTERVEEKEKDNDFKRGRAKLRRSGTITCTDCGTVYELKCMAAECPYKAETRVIGKCVIKSLRAEKFDICEHLILFKKGDISDLG